MDNRDGMSLNNRASFGGDTTRSPRDEDLRREALHMAITASPLDASPEEVVDRATAFEKYLRDGVTDA